MFDEEPDDPCMVCREKSLAALDKLRTERDALDKLATQRATEIGLLKLAAREADAATIAERDAEIGRLAAALATAERERDEALGGPDIPDASVERIIASAVDCWHRLLPDGEDQYHWQRGLIAEWLVRRTRERDALRSELVATLAAKE